MILVVELASGRLLKVADKESQARFKTHLDQGLQFTTLDADSKRETVSLRSVVSYWYEEPASSMELSPAVEPEPAVEQSPTEAGMPTPANRPPAVVRLAEGLKTRGSIYCDWFYRSPYVRQFRQKLM